MPGGGPGVRRPAGALTASYWSDWVVNDMLSAQKQCEDVFSSFRLVSDELKLLNELIIDNDDKRSADGRKQAELC